jgi:predicted Zn-ribbon and HTH transcriptional regulator
METCFFCGAKPSEESSSYTMKGVPYVLNNPYNTKSYVERDLRVPRCPDCKEAHRQKLIWDIANAATSISVAIGAVALTSFLGLNSSWLKVAVFVALFLAIAIGMEKVAVRRALKGVKRRDKDKEYVTATAKGVIKDLSVRFPKCTLCGTLFDTHGTPRNFIRARTVLRCAKCGWLLCEEHRDILKGSVNCPVCHTDSTLESVQAVPA